MTDTITKAAPSMNRGAFYRLCRTIHGYLSAVAFAALIFFSASGILLNHPEWFENVAQAVDTNTVTLDARKLQDALKSAQQGPALSDLVKHKVSLRGAYKSADISDGEAFLRYEGVAGNSDVVVNLKTGTAEARVTHADLVSMLNDLHRGKNAAAGWRAAIDITAILIIALSIIGFIIFFSMRMRLATSLTLTALGIVALAGLAALNVLV